MMDQNCKEWAFNPGILSDNVRVPWKTQQLAKRKEF